MNIELFYLVICIKIILLCVHSYRINNKYTQARHRSARLVRLQSKGFGDDDDRITAYKFTGNEIPPEFAKLFGIKSKSPPSKKKPTTTPDSTRELKRNSNKPSKPTIEATQAFDETKTSISKKPKDDELEALEKEMMWKFGKVNNNEDDDNDDDEEEDENDNIESQKFSNKPKKVGKTDFVKRNDGYKLGANQFRMRESGSDSKKVNPTVIAKQVPSTINPENDGNLISQTDAVKYKNQQRSRLFDRLKSRESRKDDVIVQDTNVDDESSVLSSVDFDEFEDDLQDDSVTKKGPVETKKQTSASVDSTYRFRKPTAAVLEAEAKEELIQANKLIESNQKKKEKEERMKQARIQSKEEAKNSFTPFDFTEESTTESMDSETIFSSESFESIGITNQQLLSNIKSMGIFTPTKIQEKIVPVLLDIQQNPKGTNQSITNNPFTVMQAMTGSGKTLGFLLPLTDVIDPSMDKVQAVIIAPSRELVTQIAEVSERLFQGLNIRTVAIIGGANVKNQIHKIRDDKPHIIVATPGRLAEIVFGLQKLKFSMVRALIVDEIDHMLVEPFVDELQTLLQAMPIFTQSQDSNRYYNEKENNIDLEDVEDNNHQGALTEKKRSSSLKPRSKRFVCFASATGNNPAVLQFTQKLSKQSWKLITTENIYENIQMINESTNQEENSVKAAPLMLPRTIVHGIISTPRIRALEYLKRFLNSKPIVKSALIFVNDPHRVEVICNQLLEMGMIAAPLHGESSKDDRKEIIARLKDGRVNLVVTTELAARGIDLPDLTHVINFELPTDAEHYVHRAGRCGRAGRQGLVMNFANPNTKFVVRRFGKKLNIKIRDCELRDGQVYLRSS